MHVLAWGLAQNKASESIGYCCYCGCYYYCCDLLATREAVHPGRSFGSESRLREGVRGLESGRSAQVIPEEVLIPVSIWATR